MIITIGITIGMHDCVWLLYDWCLVCVWLCVLVMHDSVWCVYCCCMSVCAYSALWCLICVWFVYDFVWFSYDCVWFLVCMMLYCVCAWLCICCLYEFVWFVCDIVLITLIVIIMRIALIILILIILYLLCILLRRLCLLCLFVLIIIILCVLVCLLLFCWFVIVSTCPFSCSSFSSFSYVFFADRFIDRFIHRGQRIEANELKTNLMSIVMFHFAYYYECSFTYHDAYYWIHFIMHSIWPNIEFLFWFISLCLF